MGDRYAKTRRPGGASPSTKADLRPLLRYLWRLQTLDLLTTLLGLHMGAIEASYFIGRLMRAGPVAALLIAKIVAVALVSQALRFNRPRGGTVRPLASARR